MALLGIKKLVKKDPAEKALNKYLPEIANAIFLFGKVGSGKTTTMWSLCQNYKNVLGYKFFILWGGERNEHLYPSLPNRELNYWDKIKKQFPGLKGEGPIQNKIHLIYFYWDGRMPKKLPNDPPNIKSSIVTMPYKKIEMNNISHAIGSYTSNDESCWREIIEQAKKTDGPAKVLDLGEELTRKNQILFKNFIKPFCKAKLLQADTCSYNIDLLAEFREKDVVTVFCFDFIPEEFRIFCLEWILSQMAKLLDKNRGIQKNIMALNEAAEFFKAFDDSIMPERYKIFRKTLSNYIRYGRRGLKMVLNCQSPNETRGIVSGQDDYTILCKMTSAADIEDATDHLRKANLLRKDQVDLLYRLRPGQFLFCESGKIARFQYYFKPRTLYWQPGDGDFYKHVWKKYNDNWKNIESVEEELNQQFNEEYQKLLDVKKEKQLKESLKKIRKKKTEEDDEEEQEEESILPNEEMIISPSNELENELPIEFKGEGILPEELNQAVVPTDIEIKEEQPKVSKYKPAKSIFS